MDKANLSNTFVDSILDEIALEGLDGVTISALWIRLKDRPDFPFPPVDDKAKSFLWRAVIRLSNVEFFLLPQPRAPLVLFNRTEYIDQFGNFVDPDDVPDNVYPHAAIEEDGLMGSCQYFKERINITTEVRKKDLNFAVKKWGERLVIVADQATRKFSLCIQDFNPQAEMTVLQYCFLERIGRSRYYGEVTQGKLGLQQISVDAKMLFYYRKFLTKHKLIVKQTFHLKIGKQNCTGSLLHLTRFCKVVKTKHKTDAENLLEYLKHQPGKLMLYKDIYKLDLRVDVKKLLQKELKCIKSELVPYRHIFPDAKPQEWKIKSSSHEKSIRILRLVEEENVEEINEEEEEDEEDESGFLDMNRRVMDRSIIRQTYTMVERAGKEGLTQHAISTLMGVSSLHSRSLCKQLVKKNLCGNMLIDIGRQRVGHFYSKKYDLKESGMSAEVSEERKKLLQTIYNRNMLDKHVNKRKATDSPDDMKSTKRLALEMCEKPDESSPPVEICSNGTPSSSKLTQEDMDTIETEIIVSNPSLSGKKSFPSLTEEIQSPNFSNSNLTLRILKRANLILQAVNAQKVIHDPQKLQRMINEEEELEGFQYTVDRKSVLRLVDKLEADGHLKIIKVNLKGHGKIKNMTFICHPSVDEYHSEIQSAIDLAKMKLPIVIKETIRQKYIKSFDNILGPFVDQTQQVSFKFDQKAGRKYGYKPKYVKMHILHMFMHYLTYGYAGDPKLDQSVKLEIAKSHKLEDSFVDEMSFVYSKNNDWKMFVPPIPNHTEYGKGWSLMSDIILRLPLCLFVSIVKVTYHIPTLVEYLEHPIRRNYLVKNIPSEITSHLTKHRKYIFSISEAIRRLGYIGLIQVGPQRLKEKDQIFYYLNRKACLIDTTPSDIGYNQVSTNKDYEQINYTFKTAEDVEQYWYDLWNFAMHTNLGCRTSVTGQPIVVESINTKKDVIAAVLPKTVAEAKKGDRGYIPGDKLGAAGVDSDMFVHLKRNWYWTSERGEMSECSNLNNILCPPNINQLPSQRSENKTSGKVRIMKTSTPSNTINDSGTPLTDLSPSTMGGVNKIKQAKSKKSKIFERLKTTSIVRDHWKSKAKPKRITRIVKPKNTKYGRKPYYDQKDREALTRMVKLRVDWTAAEDNLLLICKVASLYMCPTKRRHVLKNFCAVREILHSTFPETSRNKTSRACQRRMHYMMRNPSTVNSVYLCLEEIKQDTEIVEKFDKSVEKLDAVLKAKGEGPKGCQREYDKIYTDLVTTLMHKLKTVARKEKNMLDSMTIPNTVRQFYDSFNVIIPKTLSAQSCRFNEVQNTVDILCSVVNTIIHSSLCCSNDKTSYSYQLFNIYKQYPDKLLRSVMAKCRSMSIVSCRKRYKRWKAAGNGCLPLTSSPYQLSITYVNILQCRYQYSIFSECYSGFNNLMEEERKKLNAITESDNEPSTSSSVENSEQLPDDKFIELKVNNGGQCANVVELFSAGFMNMNITFPEHLIILDPRLSENEENYSNVMERFKELISIIKKTEPPKAEPLSLKPEEDGEVNVEEEENDSEEDCDEGPENSEPAENSENPLQDASGDKSQNENGEEFDEEFLTKKCGIAKAASRLAIYMMRDEPLESLDKSLQHAHDYFVLNPCKISISLISEEEARSRVIDVTKKENLISEIKRLSVFPENHVENNEIIDLLKSDVKCSNLLAQFLDFLEQKKELGATFMDIEDNFGSSEDVQGLLELLVTRQFILKSGSINVRFIHNKCTKPWLVRSHFIPRRAREIKINVERMDKALNHGLIEDARVLTEAEVLNSPEGSSNKKLEESLNVNSDKSPLSLNKEEHQVEEEEEMQIDEEDKEELLMCIDSKENDLEAHNLNDDCELEVDEMELDAAQNPDSKVLLKRKKRKWVNLSKSAEKYNDLDYSSMKSVQVVIRPWIKIDGTLNRRVLDRLLGSVLGHCLGAPGVTMDKIQARFTPALQPIHTLELVQFLMKLDCVHLYAIKSNTKPSLCSLRSKASIVPATGFERLCDTIIEPDLLAVSKFGQFIGDKAYKIDYLDTLTDSKLLKLS